MRQHPRRFLASLGSGFTLVGSMIFKINRHRGSFTMVCNEPFEDPLLSFKSKGVLIYLLTRKKDWIVRVKDLTNRSTNGEYSIYSALKELRERGYARLVVEREKGKIVRKYWSIFEKPRKTLTVETTIKETPTLSNNGTDSNNGKDNDRSHGSRSNGFNLEAPKQYDMAPELVKEFYQFLVGIRHHVGRSDLPQGLTIASKRRRLKTFRKWTDEANLLLHQLEGNTAKFREVMKWYFSHHLQEYMPSCYAMGTFREKFDALLRQMKRNPSEEQDWEVDRNGHMMPKSDNWEDMEE